MGLPISLALDGREAGTARGERAWQEVLASLRDADATFSPFKPESAISRFARGEVAADDLPGEVRAVLMLAERARVESRGAFDVRRVGPDGARVLDPNGIVKGWAVDRAAHALRVLDETDFCLSAGGDMVCATGRPDAPDWRIGVEHPRRPDGLIAVLTLRNGAVATSSLVHRGGHIVDPRTGRVPGALAAVSVVAPDLTSADVDATAAFVLGAEALDWLATRPDRSGLVVAADGRVHRFATPVPPGTPPASAVPSGHRAGTAGHELRHAAHRPGGPAR